MTDPLVEARDLAIRKTIPWIDAQLDALAGAYSRAERDSWPIQEADAHAFKAGLGAEGGPSLLHTLAQLRGLTDEEMAERVLAKVAQFSAMAALASDCRVRMETLLAAASTPEAAQAVPEAMRAHFLAGLRALAEAP